MKKPLIITDVTRMKKPRVCIFGYDEMGNAVRPVAPYPYKGITERDILDDKGRQVITPFALVKFDFIRPTPQRPHTEDWEVKISDGKLYKKLISNLSEEERKKFLEKILDKSVRDIFGAVIHDKKYIKPGEGARSLGTIWTNKVSRIDYSVKESGKYNYRIEFSDGDAVYNLPITDLAFRRYCDYLREKEGLSETAIVANLQGILQKGVFLRIGLGRPFEEKGNQCYLLVTGIYTFPDYSKKELTPGSNKELKSETKTYSVEEIRQKYPKAYTEWTVDDDTQLKIGYAQGKTILELAELLKRQPSAISARLQKLGLLQARVLPSKTTREDLFDELRNLREEIARKENIPAYMVFQNTTLHEMVKKRPVTKEEMLRIYGIGKRKFEKYGEAFLDKIFEYAGKYPEFAQRVKRSEGFLKKMLKKEPDNALHHYFLADTIFNSLKELGRIKEIEYECREAIRLDRGLFGPHLCLGKLFYELMRYKEAKEEFKEVLRITPESKIAQYYIDQIDLKLRKQAETDPKTLERRGNVAAIENQR